MNQQNLSEEDIQSIQFALAVLNRGNAIILNRGEKQKIILAARIAEKYDIKMRPSSEDSEEGEWYHETVTISE